MASCNAARRPITRLAQFLSAVAFVLFATPLSAEIAFNSCNASRQSAADLLHQTKSMFYHAFDSYMKYAFPADELRPLSCTGDDTFGGLTLSLIDTLDTLVLLKDWPAFVSSVKYLRDNLSFDLNDTVSVFETNIRVVGGLISAHGLLTDASNGTGFDAAFWYPGYDDALLRLAVDIADRLMPAFESPTGIPYGAVHLQRGVLADESQVASTAGAGSLLLEFGTLTRYTRDGRYYEVAFAAMQALHERAAWTGLVGNHINILNGDWVATDAGVGGLVDSFYEYMAKGYILFGDERLLDMFQASYASIQAFIHKRPWYLNADMFVGQTSGLSQSSLSAFFPGLQVLLGHVEPATETTRAHYSVWRRFGSLPEAYNVQTRSPVATHVNYPLRPELVESVFYLHWATSDPAWVGVAGAMLQSIEAISRVACGYAEVADVRSLRLGDLMPSFLMSETLKYMLLVFVGAADERPHWLRSGRYVLTTEAHPLLVAVEDFAELLPAREAASGASSKATVTARKQQKHQQHQQRQQLSRQQRVQTHGGEGEKNGAGVRAHRWKCKRGGRLQAYLACGYGMRGTDMPKFDVRSVQVEEVSHDVAATVEQLLRDHGSRAVRVGGVFMGRTTAYRVVDVRGHEVLLAKLLEGERLRLVSGTHVCAKRSARSIVRAACARPA